MPETTNDAFITYRVASESKPITPASNNGAVKILAAIANKCAKAVRTESLRPGSSSKP